MHACLAPTDKSSDERPARRPPEGLRWAARRETAWGLWSPEYSFHNSYGSGWAARLAPAARACGCATWCAETAAAQDAGRWPSHVQSAPT